MFKYKKKENNRNKRRQLRMEPNFTKETRKNKIH